MDNDCTTVTSTKSKLICRLFTFSKIYLDTKLLNPVVGYFLVIIDIFSLQ